jgi:hypothetical protein
MSTFTTTRNEATPEPADARVRNGKLSVDLVDGRTIAVPIAWYPRLSHGIPTEWANFELSCDGIHWPDLNEDISVEGLLRGQKSGESKKSIRRWLRYRAKGLKEPIPELPLPPELAKWLARNGDRKERKAKRSRGRKAA